MSEWKKVKLKDITVSITDGKHGDCKGDNHSGYFFVSCKDVYDGMIHYENARQITKEDFMDADRRTSLSPNDILITNSGTIGRMALVKDIPETKRTTFQKSVAIVKPNIDEVVPSYLYYLLKSKVIDFVNSSNGAAQKNLLLSTMRDFELIMDISLPTQQRIATILSRYDSLIENYQKQIKLLEEAAQRLYKEWFVDLHFPGHENTKIVDGVPEGWEKGILDNIAYESGKKVDKKYRENYGCYLPIDCLPKKSLTYVESASVLLAESSLISFKKGDIIFGAMRPYFHKVCVAQSEGLTRTTCFVLNSRLYEYREYLLMLMFENSTIKHATSISVGTTMPYTRWKDLKSMKILIPDKKTATLFGKEIYKKTEALLNLSSQIRHLTEARDRLLPKLMSGEIEV